jgi:hypothetical protein
MKGTELLAIRLSESDSTGHQLAAGLGQANSPVKDSKALVLGKSMRGLLMLMKMMQKQRCCMLQMRELCKVQECGERSRWV